METHPELDYGMPGALVHFAETYHNNGYDKKLIDSINRKPTMVTAWMLNRLLNGTHEIRKREGLISVMRKALSNSKASAATVDSIDDFLARIG